MSNIRRSVLLLTLLAGSAAHAGAQSTLPPPPAAPKAPEYVPPSQRPQRQAPPRVSNPTPTPTEQAPPAFDPKSVAFEPIWTTNADGSIQGPDTYAELAAIENNPLIDPDQMDFVTALVEEREAEMELVAQSQPRACIDALLTAIPHFDVNDEASRTRLANVAVLLNQPRGIIDTLAEQGVLSPEMAAMSHHIAMDFVQASMLSFPTTLPEGATKDDITNAQSRYLMRQGFAEPLAGFGRLARRAIEADPSLVENAEELLATQGNAFIDAAAKALAPLDDDTLKAAMTAAYEAKHGPVVK